MSAWQRKSAAAMLCASLVFLIAGRKPKHGTPYVDPDSLRGIQGTGIESQDIRRVAQEASRDLLASGILDKFKEQYGVDDVPRIVLKPVRNRTRFLIDADMITQRIADELVNFSDQKFAVVDQSVLDLLNADRSSTELRDDRTDVRIDYYLQTELRGMTSATSSAEADYINFFFRLLDRRSAAMVWSYKYDMKKEGTWDVFYQ